MKHNGPARAAINRQLHGRAHAESGRKALLQVDERPGWLRSWPGEFLGRQRPKGYNHEHKSETMFTSIGTL